MCHMIGRPPISTIGLGLTSVSSASRVPDPPAKMATFIRRYPKRLHNNNDSKRDIRYNTLENNGTFLNLVKRSRPHAPLGRLVSHDQQIGAGGTKLPHCRSGGGCVGDSRSRHATDL